MGFTMLCASFSCALIQQVHAAWSQLTSSFRIVCYGRPSCSLVEPTSPRVAHIQASDSGKLLGAGRKRHPHCRLHLKLTYLPVGEATMRRAEAADPSAPTDLPGAQEPGTALVSLYHGFALEVGCISLALSMMTCS